MSIGLLWLRLSSVPDGLCLVTVPASRNSIFLRLGHSRRVLCSFATSHASSGAPVPNKGIERTALALDRCEAWPAAHAQHVRHRVDRHGGFDCADAASLPLSTMLNEQTIRPVSYTHLRA